MSQDRATMMNSHRVASWVFHMGRMNGAAIVTAIKTI